MPKRNPTLPVLSNLALNRATLARQMLLERQPISVEATLEHLVGLQGQVHNAPYFGVWSRLENFRIADLETLLRERKAVRATFLRCTLHVLTARDYLDFCPLLQPVLDRTFGGNFAKLLKGEDIAAIRIAGREILDAETLGAAELGKRLAERWPGRDATALGMALRHLETLIHVPPAGLWGATMPPTLATALSWLGKEPGPHASLHALVLRYLKAFGPASKADFAVWSGLAASDAFERLRPELLGFAGEDGRELFDLPDAPRPDESTPAPARLVADYDNVIIGYADRSRIIDPVYFGNVATNNGIFRPTIIVDGFVRGVWKLQQQKEAAEVSIQFFEPLRSGDEAALTSEAESLLRTFAQDKAHGVRFSGFQG